ncbi:hypothetical protein EP342_02665, partial [bacterium]
MVRLILTLLLVANLCLKADEIEIPDDLVPIAGSAEILYSYELDDKPKFIQRINDTQFLIAIIDDEDFSVYLYDATKNKTEKKSEFIINDDETLYEYHLVGDKLYLYFVNYEGGGTFLSFALSTDGLYWRETVVDLKTFKPESSRIFYTSIFEEDFEMENYSEDLEYATQTVDKKIFLSGQEEKEIEPEDYRGYYITYNDVDSARMNITQLIYEDDEYKLYARNTNYYKYGDSPETKLVLLKDSVEDLKGLGLVYTYLDSQSNLFYLMSWIDDDKEKKYISFNKVTPKGEHKETIKEVPLEVDDDEYYFKTFYPISKSDESIELFGISRFEGEGITGLEPISGIYILNLNLKTMEFDLKSKTLTEDEGDKLNKGEDEMKFNRIDAVYKQDGGYVVLAENNKLHTIITKTKYNTLYTYLYYFNDINLFSVDKDLNFRWNNFMDRDFHTDDDKIFGNPLSSTSITPVQVNLKPERKGDEVTYIYSTSEPENEIRRVTYNIKTGEKVSEVSLFENNGVPSYSPGYQFPIGN